MLLLYIRAVDFNQIHAKFGLLNVDPPMFKVSLTVT